MTDKLNRQQSASQAYALTHFERKKERACILFRSYLPIYHEVPTSRPARGPFPTEGHPEDEGVAEEDR